MLTDNGSEFKNKTLRDLMEALEVNHQFAPAYHPQSNQAERANRFITETLRARRPSLTSVAALRSAVCETARQPFHPALLRLGSLPQWEEPLMLHQGS